MASQDLDILYPEDNTVEFTAKDGKRYTVPLFISFACGAYLIDNIETIKEIFPGGGKLHKLNITTLGVVVKILQIMISETYPECTEEWVKKNISLPRMGIMIFRAMSPILQYLNSMDLAKWIKNGDEDGDGKKKEEGSSDGDESPSS